jgi:hypothetical protein
MNANIDNKNKENKQHMSEKQETSSFNLEDFEELLKCDVCKDLLNDPKTLLCQHTFCTSCVANLKECPMCRLKLFLPSKTNDIFTNIIGILYGSEKIEELKNKNKKERLEKELLPKVLEEMNNNFNNTIKDIKNDPTPSSNTLINQEPVIIDNFNNQQTYQPSISILGITIEINSIIKLIETIFFLYYCINFTKTIRSGNYNTFKVFLNFIIIAQSFYTLFFKSNISNLVEV